MVVISRHGDVATPAYTEEVMCLGDNELSANVETQPSTTGMRCGAATTHLAAGEKTSDKANFWRGEEDKEGRMIGAECSGTALQLEEACNGTCNNHEKDWARNFNGLARSFVACDVTNVNIKQCIREDNYLDGNLDCRNRADEEIFQTSIKDTSLLLLNLEQIMRPCKISNGQQGLKCNSSCLSLLDWCNHNNVAKYCTELAGTTATGKTTDPQMCRNQTFWEHRSCNNSHRCTGDTPGQCFSSFGGNCLDGSSEIKEAQDGHCDGKEVMCKKNYVGSGITRRCA